MLNIKSGDTFAHICTPTLSRPVKRRITASVIQSNWLELIETLGEFDAVGARCKHELSEIVRANETVQFDTR